MEATSHHDPVVFGEMTLLDILACERGVQGEALDAAVNFHKKLTGRDAGKARHEIYVLQGKLWETEQKLNTLVVERIVLEQGWLNGPSYELAHLYVRMTERLKLQTAKLEEMVRKYGKADHIRACIEASYDEYVSLCKQAGLTPNFRFPKGFRFMNPEELVQYDREIKTCIERVEERRIEADRQRQLTDRLAAAANRAAEGLARRQELLAARKSEMERELNEFNQLVEALLKHAHFCRVGLVSPSPLKLSFVTESQLGAIGEAGYQLLLVDLQKKVGVEKRKLREPMRRIWQSVQSRGVTQLDFQEYLTQEGFGSLFTA